MSGPRAITGQMEAVSGLVAQALAEPEGIYIYWRVSDYGSLDECKRKARSLQSTFAALRTRARRSEENRMAQRTARDTDARSHWDRLGFSIEALPEGEGIRAWIGLANQLFASLEVVSAATGKPLTTIGRAKDIELDEILARAFKGDALSEHEKARLRELGLAEEGEGEVEDALQRAREARDANLPKPGGDLFGGERKEDT